MTLQLFEDNDKDSKGVAARMRPCQRAFCRRCGRSVGLFGLHGLGVARRFHEARCSAAPPAATEIATTEAGSGKALLPQVDRTVDMTKLSWECMIQMLFMSKDELTRLHAEHPELCAEVPHCVVVTWRPGSFAGAPLRPALGLGPAGQECTVKIMGKAPHSPTCRR